MKPLDVIRNIRKPQHQSAGMKSHTHTHAHSVSMKISHNKENKTTTEEKAASYLTTIAFVPINVQGHF